MSVFEDLRIRTEVSISDSFGSDEYNFITSIKADFFSLYPNSNCEYDDNEDDSSYLVATVYCTFLDIDNLDWHIFEFLDTDAGLYDLHDPFFSKSSRNQLNKSISNKIKYYDGDSLFVINELTVSEPFRGKRLGEEIISYMIHRYSRNANVTAIKPFPLDESLAEDEFSEKQKKTKEVLPINGF